MDLSQALNNVGQLLVQVLYALVILFVGWVIAKIVAALVGKLLRWLKLDERIGKAAGENKVPRLERIITLAVYYLILLFAVIAALEALGLTIVTQPLNALLNAILAYIPMLIAGGVMIFIAWLVATILRAVTRGFLEATKMDKRVGDAADLKDWPLARAVGEVVYWLVWLLFLPLIFAAFGLTALIVPVMNLLADLFGWIPNLIVAALIVVVGWFIARIVQRIATSFFAALGADKLSDRVGLSKYMGKTDAVGADRPGGVRADHDPHHHRRAGSPGADGADRAAGGDVDQRDDRDSGGHCRRGRDHHRLLCGPGGGRLRGPVVSRAGL